jgi:hypothetical protein
MSSRAIRDAICVHLGGPYDAEARAHLQPTVPGLGSVRRARPRRTIRREAHGGQADELNGATAYVTVGRGEETRLSMPREVLSELRQVAYEVEVRVAMQSYAKFSEDSEDYFEQLREDLLTRLRADPALGSGGYAAGAGIGFEVPADGGKAQFIASWKDDAEAADSSTTRELRVEFTVQQYVLGGC